VQLHPDLLNFSECNRDPVIVTADLPNNGMQGTMLHAAADAGRYQPLITGTLQHIGTFEPLKNLRYLIYISSVKIG
jgi:hypothetical protein